jgi:hypothetical protein
MRYILSKEEVVGLEMELDSILLLELEAAQIDLDKEINSIWGKQNYIKLLSDEDLAADYIKFKEEIIGKSSMLKEKIAKLEKLPGLAIRKRQIRERLEGSFVRNPQFNSIVEAIELLVSSGIDLNKFPKMYGKVTGQLYGSIAVADKLITKDIAEKIAVFYLD